MVTAPKVTIPINTRDGASGSTHANSPVPAVTVLMAVYDAPADPLDRAICSIRCQSLEDFEFLILDDGSRSEETRVCLARHAAEDPRIRLNFEAHRGLTRTLNLGLERARGRLIARQDADDWSEPDRLARLVMFLREHPEVAVCGSDCWTHQQDGTRLWRLRLPHASSETRDALWEGNPFVHGSVMFRRQAALAAGGYREEFPCAQDYDFFWRLTDAGGGANLDQPLYHYRYTSGSVSTRRAADQDLACRAARHLAAERLRGEIEDVGAALAGAVTEAAAEDGDLRAALKQADHLLLAGRYAKAGRAYLGLLRVHPARFLIWAKLLRWTMFVTLPPIREACFR